MKLKIKISNSLYDDKDLIEKISDLNSNDKMIICILNETNVYRIMKKIDD